MEQFFAVFCWICLIGLAAMIVIGAFLKSRVWYYRRKLKTIKEDKPVGLPADNAAWPSPVDKIPVLFKIFEVENDLPFVSYADFITCETKSDYKCLVASGDATKDELYGAWMNVLSQYYTLIGSKEAAEYIKNVRKIEAVNTKIFQVTKIIASLRKLYSEKLVYCLKLWGYKRPFTRESLEKDLAYVEIKISNDRLQVEIQRLEYEKAQEKKKGNRDKSTKESYMKILFAIEKHRAPARYHPAELPLYDFCILYKELEEHNQLLKLKNKGNGAR